MQRLFPAVLLASGLICGSASAGPLVISPDPQLSDPPAVDQAEPLSDPKPVLPFGGGLLAFLFGQPPATGAVSAPDPSGRPFDPPAPEASTGETEQEAPDPRFRRQIVGYDGHEKAGTVIIDTKARWLYLVQADGTAIRYGIGVGRPGFAWTGIKHISQMREWPDWRPPDQMLKRRPDLPRFMTGGPENPLGARALYLGSSLFRIHGSNEPWTIGSAVSSGCIRMRNEDVIDLYGRVSVGTKVVVI